MCAVARVADRVPNVTGRVASVFACLLSLFDGAPYREQSAKRYNGVVSRMIDK